MDDMDKVLQEIIDAEAEDRDIAHACARVIASLYASPASVIVSELSTSGHVRSDVSSGDYCRAIFGKPYGEVSALERKMWDHMGTYIVNRKRAAQYDVANWSQLWL